MQLTSRASRACLFALLSSGMLLPSAALAGGTIQRTYGPASNPVTTTDRFTGAIQEEVSYRDVGWSVVFNAVGISTGRTGVLAQVSGTVPAIAHYTVSNVLQSYTLQPPPGANFAGGKLVVYAALGPARIENNGSFELKLDVLARRGAGWDAQNTGQTTVRDAAGSEEVELPVVVDLPTTLDSTRSATVEMKIAVKATASIAPVGGQVQTATADAYDPQTRLSGFRVLNAAGAQIPGFTLSAGAASIEERALPPAGLVRAIEFYNPSYDHYFITAYTAEIASLDSGATSGWQRTTQGFNVYAASDAGRAAVCRFYGVFGAKSSHFYTADVAECDTVKANPSWTYEGIAFYALVPDATGNCPAGSAPVYRLFNQGMGGAPNHRFTTSEITFAEMQAKGYLPEGAGLGIGWCAPQ